MSVSSEAPLMNSPSEESITMPAQRGGSNKQALKVAGLTLLAGILIAGQAFTAYMAYSQKAQLSTLERRTDRLQEISRRTMTMRAPVKMHLPMSSLPLAYDVSKDEKDSSSSSTQPESRVQTQCQKDAAGEGKNSLPSFRPKCDENGEYLSQQCWDGTDVCWCVDKNGVELDKSLTRGPANCDTPKLIEPVAEFKPMEPLVGGDKE
ncbi:CD74 molecule, major histocompatibility complex, class II invariant chain b isoform X1 [Misgurnus anguillicaudatus]|uniref:CD74 molecule, major histocompatibility complex, class II invariant chain b isoform X1 n=1 Tax=Misgurnus anguillicaudatus TaxID=75329 RepID=UPI002434B967|nr:CD74 molecule, major histocompatibility complex, class II invariant chain b isoform X1 [Misgurnus anguillicaudatus]